MSRAKEAIFMGIGILAGIALSGPAVQAATNLTATLSSQPIYVDGVQVPMTAYARLPRKHGLDGFPWSTPQQAAVLSARSYSRTGHQPEVVLHGRAELIHRHVILLGDIDGNNYVRLRDIGKAVDFGVTYDADTNSVYIDTNAHYQEEPTTPAPAVLTEESVYTAIRALRDTYPTGTVYGTYYRSASNGPYGMAPTACACWATLCSDAAFDDLPWRRIENPRWEDIRPGDLLRYDNAYGGHVIVVLAKTDEYVSVTESGTNNKARWGGQYFRWWLEEQPNYTSYTRYPQ